MIGYISFFGSTPEKHIMIPFDNDERSREKVFCLLSAFYMCDNFREFSSYYDEWEHMIHE